MQQRRPVRRALLSVSDKAGIVEFAQALSARGVELLSTGGTARLLAEKGLPVTEVSDYTGFPEMMDGRVKTLHPKVHGGILGRRGQDDAIMEEHQIQPIDMVVVNLYPFAQTVAREGCSLEDAVENIDIGGPTMVRSAAKNHKDVAIVVKSSDYDAIIKEMDANEGSLTLATRFDLAIKAFEHTAAYDISGEVVQQGRNYRTLIDGRQVVEQRQAQQALALFGGVAIFAVELTKAFPRRACVQRNVMEHRHDFRFLQEANQRAPVINIPQLDVEHMRVLHAVIRNRRQLDTPGFRQRC